MAFVPGSHEWPDVGGGDFFSQDPDSLDFNIPDAAVWQEIPACMPAGGFSIHDKMTIHGSSPNSSGMPRRSLAIHIRTDKSHPVKKGSGFARFLNNPMINPIIFGEKISSAF